MNVHFFVAKMDAPSARWRILQLVPHLKAAGIHATVEEIPAGMVAKLSLAKRAAAADVVVLQKKLLPKLISSRLRKHAKRLVFEFDDEHPNYGERNADAHTGKQVGQGRRHFEQHQNLPGCRRIGTHHVPLLCVNIPKCGNHIDQHGEKRDKRAHDGVG